MKLYYQTHSPFARKVLVAAHETGLAGRLSVEHHETSPTNRNEEVYALNPLGQVPILVTDDGRALFDSDVICAWLDSQHGGPKLIPAGGEARWRALQLQSLAQGMSNFGGALRWETVRRPEKLRYPPLQQSYAQKLVASYDWLEQRVPEQGLVDIGTISLAAALGWLDFRKLVPFRPGRPRLAVWFDDFDQRPSMQATRMSGETQD